MLTTSPTPQTAKGTLSRGTSVRIDPELAEALDALVAKRNEGRVGPQWTRSDVVRDIILAELQRSRESD